MTRPDPSEKAIGVYFHCATCFEATPPGESPASYQRITAGYTKLGLQVWCVRCDKNILHVDFARMRFYAKDGKGDRDARAERAPHKMDGVFSLYLVDGPEDQVWTKRFPLSPDEARRLAVELLEQADAAERAQAASLPTKES